jgi:hypothetical protein
MKISFTLAATLIDAAFVYADPLTYTEVAKLISNFLFYSTHLMKPTNTQWYIRSGQIMERNAGGLCKYSGGKGTHALD